VGALRKKAQSRGSRLVIAGFDPAISIRMAQWADDRDGQDKSGHDRVRTVTTFAPLTTLPGIGAAPVGLKLLVEDVTPLRVAFSPIRRLA